MNLKPLGSLCILRLHTSPYISSTHNVSLSLLCYAVFPCPLRVPACRKSSIIPDPILDLANTPASSSFAGISTSLHCHPINFTVRMSFLNFLFLFFCVSLKADGHHSILPVVNKVLSIIHLSPVHALRIFIAMLIQHSCNLSTNMVEIYLLTFSSFPQRKKEHKFW